MVVNRMGAVGKLFYRYLASIGDALQRKYVSVLLFQIVF